MAIHVIGAGVGRTGTHSLKLAINQLGLGPCHHMEEVLHQMPVQVPLWSAALGGHPDWEAIYRGYESAVDWPTAGFFRELIRAYPSAKFVLTHRSPDKWADSFGATIQKLVAEKDQAPPEMKAWLEMAGEVIAKTGFPADLDRGGLIKAFVAHNEAVKSTILAKQLLVYEVKDGWAPLCEFLAVPVPAGPFPRTNAREEFWDRVSGKI
ncbi:MAG TPA: sulfotransferase [Vicinamibacterales bacterium]|nr:sulfotransferase [Vicinamibacterales bacterium]